MNLRMEWEIIDGPSGVRYTPKQAQNFLVRVLSDPVECDFHFAMLCDIDPDLLVTAALCNDDVRQRIWSYFTDDLKFAYAVGTPVSDAALREAAADVVALTYGPDSEGMV
jgi:hypothetical protein